MRKVFLNNDRSQIAFFVGVLSDGNVAIETLTGELQTLQIDKVGMLDLTERERYEFMIKDEKRSFETQKDIFISLLSKVNSQENLSDEEIVNICNIAKKQANIFIQQYNGNNQ